LTKQRRLLTSLGLHLFITPLALLFIAPILWMVIAATEANHEIISSPPAMLPGDSLRDNWEALNEDLDYPRVVGNSIVIAVTHTVLATLISAMGGYAFAKFEFRGKTILFGLIIATLTIPYSIVVIPQYLLVAGELHLTNTFWGVLLPGLANALGVFFMRQNMLRIPDELLDAARVDGAGELRIFTRIVLPISVPYMAAIAIILFLTQWNDFLWPLLMLTSRDSYTIPVALGTMVGLTNVSWGGLMIGTAIATLPFLLLFLALQRYFISGITSGAVKG
jgi:lactose/L-arabinose transport system permease protein